MMLTPAMMSGRLEADLRFSANPGQSDPGFERPFRIETGPG
jgi:hypothetical protein